MSETLMNTREVAEYLDINEKKVYALIKSRRIPATRITGKWLFPKDLVDAWLLEDAHAGLTEARQRSRQMGGALLAAGSNDPVLDILQASLRKDHPEFYIFSASTGSRDGLLALNAGYTDIAWTHLWNPQDDTYNIPFLAKYMPDRRGVVVNLFYRELGLVTGRGNPSGIHGFDDLAREGVRFINRQPGAGTRVLLDIHLGRLGIEKSQIAGYEQEAFTHLEVGLAVLSGKADVGIASIAIANFLGLDFVPITRERFDMVLDQNNFFEKPVQLLMDVLHDKAFRQRVGGMSRYDFSDSGRILYSAS
ncbi:helix-turn-helix transcriptional regulator [Syntrophus aciditrophicus]|uniref:Molybdate-binding protein domain n=1 Tax=Syntrophus aciditrophicus (strain SB) TaxID=56780 RepID=Q2LY92_SYNAS|nr:helix-turn-helix transcriptional regulator [Syntrophus aciditrophicus]ABC76035.1 molybdate-binding protein domain [Syntrophus aciditrophicus SB]